MKFQCSLFVIGVWYLQVEMLWIKIILNYELDYIFTVLSKKSIEQTNVQVS